LTSDHSAARPLVLAHRGDHRRWIENTADALLEACRLPGVDGVEFDVRAAADGEPIVLHDETLERTFGLPVVARDETALNLVRTGVPHLADVLALLPADAFLDIELKDAPTAAMLATIAAVRGSTLHRAVVSSFNASILAEVRARQPGWTCWLNAVQLNRWSIAAARAVGCAGVSAHWRSVTEQALAEASLAGLAVAAWTVRRRPTRRRLERLPLSAVIVEGPAIDPHFRSHHRAQN
jgi:glycerophosphoryl diester phosphodiesterase